MKRIALTLLCFASSFAAQPVFAQAYYPERYGPPRGEIFERTQFDLSRAADHAYDRRRIAHAQHEIGEFQRRFRYGRYSRHDLDEAIAATDDVVRRAALAPPDRDILYLDLEGMRAFRSYTR